MIFSIDYHYKKSGSKYVFHVFYYNIISGYFYLLIVKTLSMFIYFYILKSKFFFFYIETKTYLFLSISLNKIIISVLKKNMQHTSKFQLIETTTYLFLSIYLDKVTINVLTKHVTCILDKITTSIKCLSLNCSNFS